MFFYVFKYPSCKGTFVIVWGELWPGYVLVRSLDSLALHEAENWSQRQDRRPASSSSDVLLSIDTTVFTVIFLIACWQGYCTDKELYLACDVDFALIVGHHWRRNELWETSKGTSEKIRIPVDSVGMRVLDILLVGSKCKCLWQLRYRRNTAVESSVTDALVDRIGGVQTSSRTPDLHCAVTAGRSQMNTCNTI